MQVNIRGANVHLNVGNATKSNREGWAIPIEETGVANDHSVAAAAIWIRRHPRLEVHGARLLFALKDILHVHWQAAACGDERLECAEVDHDLALVVGRAATEHPPVANDRFEWAGFPEVDGIARLHVVVAVDHHGRKRAIDDLLGNHNWMTARLAHLNAVGANATELGGEPLCGGPAIWRVLRESGNTRDLQKLCVLRHPRGGRCNEVRLLWPL